MLPHYDVVDEVLRGVLLVELQNLTIAKLQGWCIHEMGDWFQKVMVMAERVGRRDRL